MATRIVFTPTWTHQLEGIVDDRVVEHVAGEVRKDAAQGAPRGATGRLKASFIVAKPGPLRRWIGSTLWWFRFVEFGTDPHEIVGDPSLWWPGRAHPVRRVQHPGGTPRPHLRPALFKKRPLPRF